MSCTADIARTPPQAIATTGFLPSPATGTAHRQPHAGHLPARPRRTRRGAPSRCTAGRCTPSRCTAGRCRTRLRLRDRGPPPPRIHVYTGLAL